MAKSVVGLDVTSRRLLAVEVENPGGKKPTVARAHHIELSPAAARDSEILDAEEVTGALRRLWAEARFRSKQVVLGVGNQRVLVREHSAPVIPLAQLQQSLPYQVADLLPVPVDETILDFYPIEPIEGSAPPEMRGLLVAALKDVVEANVRTLVQAGLSVAGVDLSAFAMVRALAPSGVLQGTHTIVSIGTRTTHIIVVRDGTPRFVRIIPSGGESVTDAIEPLVNGGRATAETVKQRIGLEGVANPQYADLAKAMFASMHSLINSIRGTNSYYVGSEQGAPIESVILLGLDAHVPGLPRAVAENVGLPVRLGRPLEGFALGHGIDAEALGMIAPDLAVPIGLALGGR